MNKPEIFAKASLTEEQISVKENIGCDGIEVQLLGEMIVDRKNGKYKSAEESYDLSLLSKHEIRVVHAPIVKGLGDITLERMADDVDGYLMDQIFFIAEEASKFHGRNTMVVMHSEEFYDRLSDMGDSWKRIVEKVALMLQRYPHTELLIENVSPLRDIGKGKELHLANNCTFDNVTMVNHLRNEISTDRIGTCLDTCHQMLTEKYLTVIYQAVADVPCPNYSIGHFVDINKNFLKLVHLCDMTGSGYGSGRHGVPFHMGSYPKLAKILKTFEDAKVDCPLTLEVEETDFSVCSGYKNTKEQVDRYFKESNGFLGGADLIGGVQWKR